MSLFTSVLLDISPNIPREQCAFATSTRLFYRSFTSQHAISPNSKSFMREEEEEGAVMGEII